MTLKAGFVLFYVTFLSIIIFLSTSMGETIISASSSDISGLQSTPQFSNNIILLPLELIWWGFNNFLVLLTISTEFQFLGVFVLLPMTVVMIWVLIELIGDLIP